MENLHLKNLNNNDPFEFYVKNSIKQIETYQNKIKEIHNKTLTYLLDELENIKIINSKISEFKNDIIANTRTNSNIKFTNNNLYELICLIHNFEKIKDIDLEIKLDTKNFFRDVAEIYCDYFTNTFGGTWEYESYKSPKYYNYDTDSLYIKCTNPNYKLKTTLINYQNDILNEEINTKDIEIYDIYHDYYGYECFQHNTIITIKGITI